MKNKTRKPKPQLLVFSAIFFLLTIVGLFTGPCWWVVVPGAVGMVAFLPEAKKWIGKKKESELDFWIKHREYYIELLDNRMLFRVFVLIAIAGIGNLFEKNVECQANRLSSQETVSKEDLMSILSEDIIHARLSCGHIIKEIVPRKP